MNVSQRDVYGMHFDKIKQNFWLLRLNLIFL